MRYTLILALALGLLGPVSVPQQTPKDDIWITIAPSGGGGGSAAIRVLSTDIYVDGNWVAIGGREKKDPQFSMRAWKVGEKARVVVYARLEDPRAPAGSTETPIATFVIAPKETVQVPEAEKWGGARLAVTAALR